MFPDRSPVFLIRQHGKLVNEDDDSALVSPISNSLVTRPILCRVKSPLSAASCVCAVAVHCRVVTSEIRTVIVSVIVSIEHPSLSDVSSRGKSESLNRSS